MARDFIQLPPRPSSDAGQQLDAYSYDVSGATRYAQALVLAGTDGTPVSVIGGRLAVDADVTVGDVTVDNFPDTYDVSDRADRLLGHVTVDNPPDLSALATIAKQDEQTAVLGTIAGLDYATETTLTAIETVLAQVRDNTADIKLDADHLSITADAINLNTDGVESRLDTLNAKDFATQTTLAALKARGDLLATEATLAAASAKLPAALIGGRLDVNLGASGITLGTDPTDRAGRLLGHVTVDSLPGNPAQTADVQAVRDRLPAALVGGRLDVNIGAATTLTADTELPAAAALGDGASNPTVPGVGAFLNIYNGSGWDRARGDTANGLDVDVTRVQGTVAVTQSGAWSVAQSGAWSVTADTELAAAAALADAVSNPTIPGVGAFLMGYNGATFDRLRSTTANGLVVDVSRVQGTVAATQSGAWTFAATQSGAWSVTADTELPAAAALGDGAANPTVPGVGSFNEVYNGATWDRARSASGASTGIQGVAGDSSVQTATLTSGQTLVVDARAYRWVSVQVTGALVASGVTFEFSNDNANWTNAYLTSAGGAGAPVTFTLAAAVLSGPVNGRYFRVSAAVGAGSVAVTALFSAVPSAPQAQYVQQVSTVSLNTDSVAAPDPIPAVSALGGVYSTATSQWDRMRSATSATATTGAGLLGAGMLAFDGTNYQRLLTASNVADGATLGSSLAAGNMLYNGTTFDRIRSAAAAAGTTGTGLLGAGLLIFDGTNYVRLVTASGVGDGSALGSSLAISNYVYNGTNFDRMRSANSATAGAGAGLLGVGVLAFDGTNYQRLNTASNVADGATLGSSLATGNMLYNGTTFDRIRSAASATGTTGTGLLGAGLLGFDGTNYQRLNTGAGAADGSSAAGLLGVVTYFYNGATFDRARGDTTNGLDVDVTRVQGTVTVDSELPAAAALADATSNPTVPGVGAFAEIYNGTNWDRLRSVVAATGTTGTGLLGAAMMASDGTNYVRLVTASAVGDGAALGSSFTVANMLWNGSNYDRSRTANSATGNTGTGLLGAGMLAFDGTNYQRLNTASNVGDGNAGSAALPAGTYRYNGATLDRERGNEDVTLLASASRTTTQTSADLINYNGNSALVVTLDVTTPGTGSITLSIQRKDVASGKYVTLLTGTNITIAQTNVYKVGPQILAAANSIAQDYLGRTFRIVVTANNANAMTYSVGYTLVRE